MATNIKQMD